MEFIKKIRKRYIVIAVIILIIGVFTIIKWDEIENLFIIIEQSSPEDVAMVINSWGFIAPLVSIFLMVVSSFIAPIPSFLITGANGIIFGVVGGIVISWVGAMLGAAGTFYFARYYGEDIMKKFKNSSKIVKKVDEISEKHGATVVFVARLLPMVSFDLISYAAGLSTIKPWKFFLATGVGMIPGTIAYVLLGSEIMKLAMYYNQIIIVTVIGVIVYILCVYIKKKIEAKRNVNE